MNPTESRWRGFVCLEDIVDGRPCKIVCPDTPAPGRPWAWRPEFFDAFAGIDEALVRNGFHLAYLDVVDHYGSPKAIAHGEAFHRHLVTLHGLSTKPAFIALSRGGLFAFNWAASHPDKVACIYADNPVCDFKSWPAGQGTGKGSPTDWGKCLAVYGLNEITAVAYQNNPVHNAAQLAAHHIPLFQVYGDRDDIVPAEENAVRMRAAYLAAGAPYNEIVKPGAGHHPHGLDDPLPLTDFMQQHAGLCDPDNKNRQRSVTGPTTR
jgi:pimeloyl-ACP methyl ester carboxylesterase